MFKERYAAFGVKLFRCLFLAELATMMWSVMLCLIFATSLPAQERVRTASQGLGIETYRRAPDAFFYLGPLQENLHGSLGVQYTDNVNLADTAKISDLSVIGALSLNTTWVLSQLNQIQLNFGGALTEHFYGNGRDQLKFVIDPNSKLEFKFALGNDFLLRFYDQFSYVQNPTNDPTATNTANLNSLTNTIGAVIDADLRLAVLSLAADYTYNNESGTNVEGQNNPSQTGTRETFRVGSTLTFRLSPTITYGGNAVATRSTGVHAASVNSLNLGPFITGKLNRDLEFDLAGGATLLDTKPHIPPGYYFSAAIRYQLTRHLQLLASGSHELIFTVGTGLTEENLFRIGTQLNLTRTISLTVSPFINFGDIKTTNEGTIDNQGDYKQFGIEAGVGWRIRKRWSSTLTYDYVRRESGTTFGTGAASGNYIQNTVLLQLNYLF